MNPPNMRPTQANGARQQSEWPVGRTRPFVPGVAQTKSAAPARGVGRPDAPPAYRPQPVPKVLQRKAASTQRPPNPTKSAPSAPPVYSPHPQPKVLQRTKAVTEPQPNPQVQRRPVAPPVYRPHPAPAVLQRKAAGTPRTQADVPNQKGVVRPCIERGVTAAPVIQAKGVARPPQTQPPSSSPRPNSPPRAQGRTPTPRVNNFRGGVVQRSASAAVAEEQHSVTVGDWKVTQDDELEVKIEHAGSKWRVRELHPVHHLSDATFAMFGNCLYGGYTILSYDGGRDQVKHRFSKNYGPYSPSAKHTEPQLMDAIEDSLTAELEKDSVIGAIIEFKQTNTPCATCQGKLATFVNGLKTSTGKKVILRAQALVVYQSAPGVLGRGMADINNSRRRDDGLSVPYMDANTDGYLGIHNHVPVSRSLTDYTST